MTITALLKLAGLTNDPHYVDLTHLAPMPMQSMMTRYPLGFGPWLQAPAYALSKPREIAIVGDPSSAETQALLDAIRDGYRPFQVVALGSPDAQPVAVPSLRDRASVEGQATAYICRGLTCQPPVTEPEKLQAQLEPRWHGPRPTKGNAQ